MKVYPRDGRFLVVLPEMPQWFVLDELGLKILHRIRQGRELQDVLSEFPGEDADELTETFHGLIELSRQNASGHDSRSIERALTSRTTVAMICLTRHCNLRCPHCYVDATGTRGQELTLDEHQALAKDLHAQLAVDPTISYKVNLTGGEPFFREDIIEIIRAYRQAGFAVTMSTNALLIREEHLLTLAEMEVDLSISLDGARKASHEMIRGEGTYEPTIMTIQSLVRSGIKVAVNTLLHEGNINELEEIISLNQELGCNGFNPINLVQLGRACDSHLTRASETQVFRHIAAYLKLHPECNHLFSFSSLFSSIGAALLTGVACESCGIGNRPCVYIDEVGNIYPCPNTQRPEFLMGNIRQGPLAQCVAKEHPVLTSLREIKVDCMNPKCASCDVRYFCGGDCRGETHNVTGDIRAPYVACSDRHDSIVELMWIVAENPDLFEERSAEYERHIP